MWLGLIIFQQIPDLALLFVSGEPLFFSFTNSLSLIYVFCQLFLASDFDCDGVGFMGFDISVLLVYYFLHILHLVATDLDNINHVLKQRYGYIG